MSCVTPGTPKPTRRTLTLSGCTADVVAGADLGRTLEMMPPRQRNTIPPTSVEVVATGFWIESRGVRTGCRWTRDRRPLSARKIWSRRVVPPARYLAPREERHALVRPLFYLREGAHDASG